ncbi:MAG: TIR domain-containing protein, partial [Mogibacterium sp.]|nr:TIR domain-containing protein [Mogibacterium sp.]
MSELIHKTREGSSTYGKPRVYMSFYKTDLEGPVSELCEDILRINNCAVYMYDDGFIPAGAETREAEMGQMQLFVLVCTPGYMSEQNTSRDREILFALAHGIPVLPVIPGENVIDPFNALCARLGIESLHCLDRNEFTGNDEGYRGKLKEHLDYFLISDEDSAKIKDEFRACIFLSYRKVDRDYARSLIRRIHGLQKYYDVAVWYDDYLVPGRSFEDEIFSAMDRSDLFILAVTPNIVAINAAGEENYVVRKEYPEALERGKKIVAAELDRTDRGTLLIKFDDLPECINAWDELALDESLSFLDAPENCEEDSEDLNAEQKAEREAAHKYYIGLAYLNGINAETDTTRAFELISSAADSRFEPAMDRLVRMYRSGIAVPRDYEKAIEWQQKLIDLTEERLNKEETAENAHLFLYRLGQLGNFLTEQGDDNAAVENYERLLRLADKYTELFPLADLYRDVSVACNKLGDVYLLRQEYEKARDLFESGWRAAGVLAEETSDEVFIRDYAVSCQKLGQVYRMTGEFGKAKERYSEAYDIVSEIVKREPTAANIRDEYITVAMLGDTAFEMQDHAAAEEKYLESRRLRKIVDRETGADWAKRDISVIWEKLGDLYTKTGRMREAADAFEQAVYTADELFEKTGLPVHEEELSKMCT